MHSLDQEIKIFRNRAVAKPAALPEVPEGKDPPGEVDKTGAPIESTGDAGDAPPAAASAAHAGALSSGQGQQADVREQARGLGLDGAQSGVRRGLSEGAEMSEQKRRAFAPLQLRGNVLNVMTAENMQLHPLVQATTWTEEDRLKGPVWERDHCTWDGRWTMPSSFDLEAMEAMGAMWPTGGAEYEVNSTGSNSKVMKWKKLDEETRAKFRERRLWISGKNGWRMRP